MRFTQGSVIHSQVLHTESSSSFYFILQGFLHQLFILLCKVFSATKQTQILFQLLWIAHFLLLNDEWVQPCVEEVICRNIGQHKAPNNI